MGRLIYAMNCSLDGYVNDANGEFGWSEPDVELHDYFTELTRRTGTFLYGRRIHEVMRVWEDFRKEPDLEPHMRAYADAWCAVDKIVYSSGLDDPGIPRARVARRFDADEVRALKESSELDLSVAGPTLAAAALRAGLVDEVQLAFAPVVIGGGTPVFPEGLRVDLELVAERRFPAGAVLVTYRVR
ncbi:dihydrofolate reductase family protein [Demequina sp. SYSU T00192]|uniref:Dihydrofolate reductase family protein n=1 Tax=Demequina litoralis TaxID=3051660 RepID=A0ABT8GCM8_9MICO|nr:dihydrofolate reductase family protein [Demequina sp. SYSU T00192]MDN4476419.1 dihydrofolate reductase family protein [Demequina sp. SYSU T00192]